MLLVKPISLDDVKTLVGDVTRFSHLHPVYDKYYYDSAVEYYNKLMNSVNQNEGHNLKIVTVNPASDEYKLVYNLFYSIYASDKSVELAKCIRAVWKDNIIMIADPTSGYQSYIHLISSSDYVDNWVNNIQNKN
jgi:hypothetical protein